MYFFVFVIYSFTQITIFGIFMLKDEDRRLLRYLQSDPTLAPSELARICGLSAQAVTRRLNRLRAQGVLRAVHARIDWRALGYAVEVSLRFTLDKTQPRAFEDFIAAARAVPEVLEIQTFLGRVDVRLSVIARDMGHYQALYRDRILTLPHIADIQALMHVARIKSDESLPI